MTRSGAVLTLLTVILVCGVAAGAAGQDAQPRPLTADAAQMQRWFEAASEEFDVPVEVLQAVAYVESRWRHLVPEAEPVQREAGSDLRARESRERDHEGPPPAYGVMGLRDDAHFGYSLREAAVLIGRTPEELKESPELNIRGAAALLRKLGGGATRETPLEQWEDAVALYSGIPQPEIAEVYTYDAFAAIRGGRATERFRVAQRDVDLVRIYGEARLQVLSAPMVTVEQLMGRAETNASPDYPSAIWNAAASCNYGAGRSSSITHVAEHIAQGSYSGTISWFKNCSASVSAHYVVRSSDGQVTQMVHEADTAWHVASHNSYTVGIEHEGWAEDCAWYSTALYNGSSLLTRNIADRRGIPRTATYDASLGWDTELARDSQWKIKGHTNFPTTKTCPGICWDWPRFRSLVIGTAGYSRIVDNATAGRFTASSNWLTSSFSSTRYGADYRYANPQAVSDAAWYKFDIPATGNYEVFVWYPSNSGYNSSTPVIIVTSSGNVTRNVDQRVNGGMWISLGTFQLSAGDNNKVGISRWTSGTGYVIADAVKIEGR
ncbi:MAG TPA: N-acetylmuramoyl-L-alanine amidase [Thermoanaerobaculia bacterium]|nr:N-acetylmuramoyl-L-alanine amidase [Thermoanaerobaculia bacterium]